MLEFAEGLTPAALDAIAELERRVVAADGGRLKLEWGVLRGRSGRRVEDLLWWDGEHLLGFLGLYGFGAPTVELAGMVDPGARRRGIATALLDAALPLCRDQGYTQLLLVTPRSSTAARELALARGAVLDHSEHALQLHGAPSDGPSDPRISLRPMTSHDTAAVDALLEAGFGWHPPQPTDEASADVARRDLADTWVVMLDDAIVGSLRLSRDQDTAGVYGFVIHPDHQGRGIGRDVLRRVCLHARADGATRVNLEVAVDNDRALTLYTSLGFALVTTEDYYALPS
ncbi:MAG: GNAT family N-acetyltransferase [Kineosporiaceae bacterium]